LSQPKHSIVAWGQDFVSFARAAGYPFFFATPKRTTVVGGLETYRQLHALYMGALPSEVL